MQRHKLAITPNADGHGAHKLEIDGKDISHGVRSLTVTLDAGGTPHVELDLAVVEVERMEFETPDLYIPDAAREALMALGWTPPRTPAADLRDRAREWITDFHATTDDDRVNCVALLLGAADDALRCAMNHERAEGRD